MSAYSINPTALMLMNQISDDERRHIQRLQNAWKRYQGDWPDPLKVPVGQRDYYNLKANFAREFVDKSVTQLFGGDVGFELDTNTRDRTPEEQYLDSVWAANKKQTWLQKYAMNGCVTGHAFVLIEPPNPERGREFPRLINLEPEIVWPMWDELDVESVYKYKIQFNTTDRDTGEPITRRKDIEQDGDQWVIRDFVARARDARFVQIGEEVWEYPWPPIIHNQNLPSPNEFWGVQDLTDDRLDLMHGLNRLISNVNKIIFNDAHAKLYAQGFFGESGENLKSWGIGEIKGVPEGSEIKRVDTSADIGTTLEFIREMKSWLHEQANIPEVAVGKVDNIGALSGVALQILYQPLTAMTETKRTTYGDALNDLNKRLLELGGHEVQETTLVWQELLPVDELAQAQAAQAWYDLGASQETILERGGFDPDKERERRVNDDAAYGEMLIRNQQRGGDAVQGDD